MKIMQLPNKIDSAYPERENWFCISVPITVIPNEDDRRHFSENMCTALMKLAEETNEAITGGATEFRFYYVNIRDSLENLSGDKGQVIGLAYKKTEPIVEP
jgi:hypothetical protein